MAIDENDPYRKALVQLLHSIDDEIHLEKGSRLTMLHLLNSEEKIVKFNEWIMSRLEDGKLNATETEIVRAAVQASKD